MLTVTLKWANKCFKKMLEPAPGANFFFENEEKLKNLIFSLSLNEEKKTISNFLFGECSII